LPNEPCYEHLKTSFDEIRLSSHYSCSVIEISAFVVSVTMVTARKSIIPNHPFARRTVYIIICGSCRRRLLGIIIFHPFRYCTEPTKDGARRLSNGQLVRALAIFSYIHRVFRIYERIILIWFQITFSALFFVFLSGSMKKVSIYYKWKHVSKLMFFKIQFQFENVQLYMNVTF